MTRRLANKTAFITGAARGIGRAQAVRFAQEGAAIIAVDVCGPVASVHAPPSTPEDFVETVSLVEQAGGQIVSDIVDVRDLDMLQAVADRGATFFGGIDIVCATAGITSRSAATEMSENTWRTMLDVNLTGVWHTCKVAVPHLIDRRGGSVVLVNSIAGLRGLLGIAHYAAAKHGVVGLMRSLSIDLAPHGIRVNCVHPTNVDTPLIQNDAVRSGFRPDLDRSPSRDEFAEAATQMNLLAIPWVQPVDVANASLFLASDESRYVTSVSLPVDAGSTQR
jgi:SDR family mycofactocin-dependent oxidoreductase